MSDSPFARGACRCGAITLEIAEKPAAMVQCHCSDCQKITGTGHANVAMFREDAVSIHGEATTYTVTSDRGNQLKRAFCPTCGSRMYHHNSGRPGVVAVMVGCLEDHRWFAPQRVIYTAKRSPWDHTTQEVPNFEGWPEG